MHKYTKSRIFQIPYWFKGVGFPGQTRKTDSFPRSEKTCFMVKFVELLLAINVRKYNIQILQNCVTIVHRWSKYNISFFPLQMGYCKWSVFSLKKTQSLSNSFYNLNFAMWTLRLADTSYIKKVQHRNGKYSCSLSHILLTHPCEWRTDMYRQNCTSGVY